MNRDVIIQRVVSAAAQLHRIERLSKKIGDAAEHRARIPPLLEDLRRQLQSLAEYVGR